MQDLSIITRESTLALAQTLTVAEKIASELKISRRKIKIIPHKTVGDLQLDAPLYEVAANSQNSATLTKSLFTTELEHYLIDETADLAVHSLKDLPTELPVDFHLLDIQEPTNTADCLIVKKEIWQKYQNKIFENPLTIACSSLRRKALLFYYNSQIHQVNLRGNVISRFLKLQQNAQLDGMLLAVAGLRRLQKFYQKNLKQKLKIMHYISGEIQEKLDHDAQRFAGIDFDQFVFLQLNRQDFPPAVSQGVLGLEAKRNSRFSNYYQNQKTLRSKKKLWEKIQFQRAILNQLEAGCHAPFGIHIKKTSIQNKRIYRLQIFYDHGYQEKNQNMAIPLFYQRYSLKLDANLVQEIVTEIIAAKNQKPLTIYFCGTNSQNFANALEQTTQTNRQEIIWRHLPLIETRKRKIKQKTYNAEYDMVFVSSSNCLNHLDRMPRGRTFFCPGETTAKAIQERLSKPEYADLDYEIISIVAEKSESKAKLAAEKMLEHCQKKNLLRQNILWLTAKKGETAGIKLLRQNKMAITVLHPYSTKKRQIQGPELSDDITSYWIFTSPSCVKSYLTNRLKSGAHRYACLGHTTANFLIKKGLTPYIIATETQYKELLAEISGQRSQLSLRLQEIDFSFKTIAKKIRLTSTITPGNDYIRSNHPGKFESGNQELL